MSAGAAAALIDLQFPKLAPARVELLGLGFDNWAYRVNERYVFRFPRRKLGAELLEREIRVVPLLAPHVQLPISCPSYVGRPANGYPYLFAGYPYLPGTTACRVAWTESERAANAKPLGEFLAALHGIEIPDSVREWAPGDNLRRADLLHRAPMIKEKLGQIDLPANRYVQLVELVDTLTPTPPWDGPTRWLHGDLYARHLIVDESRRISGVIDWGDTHLGDPAEDLSIAFSFLPPSARTQFREAYGPVDEATWDRARFRAIFYGAFLIHYGREIGDAAISGAGFDALNGAA